MKLKNRVLSFLLVVCMLATLLPVSAMAVGTDHGVQTQAVEPQANAPETDESQTEAVWNKQNIDGDVSISLEEQAEALEANQPEQAEPAGVTVEEVENPGVDLKRNLNKAPETVEQAPFAQDETVRVIVVLEDKGLLEQGFTTAQIASTNAKVERQVETLAKRQENVLTAINRVVDAPVEAKYHYNVALNGLAVEVPYGDLEDIRNLPGVKTAFVAPCYDVPEDMTDETADPYTYATKDTVGSALTWETLGYTGQGMRIAIIDTGLDEDHPSFAAAPVLTETSLTLEEVEAVMTSLNAYSQYTAYNSAKLTADKLYRSAKVPFGFNYVDSTLDITHDNDDGNTHGTHVAGIAAANRMQDTDVVGVAPDAQLIVMKVFGQKGGAFFDDILAALEDCYRLDVDAVNMSLGTPAGFTSEGDYIDEIFGRILESDMIAAISSGNSYSAAYGNGYGNNRNLTKDPDNSVVSSPGTYVGGTVVASVENGYMMSSYIAVAGKNLAFTDIGKYPFTDLAGQELPYVMVPGYGTVEDFAQVDVTGKVAVVSRGSSDPEVPVSFVEKQTNACNGGAIAIIVYDNTDSTLGYMVDAELIPNVFVSKASGAVLAEEATDGNGILTVHSKDEKIPVESALAGLMSDFSSWGVAPNLELMPDITAPGGNIYSTVNGGYGTMSGTSMAAPHIAGMSALVLQYLRDQYDLKDSQAHTIAEALLMSTAKPVIEPSGLEYSPRKQGSGSANVYDAITSPVYLTVNGDTPKASCGDDDNRTGVYRFSFEVNNLTDESLTYGLDSSVLTDQVDLTEAGLGRYFMGETSRALSASVAFSQKNGELPRQYDYNNDGETNMADVQALLDAVNGLAEVKSGYDLTGDGKTDTADAQALYELVSAGFTSLNLVEVPANGSVCVNVTVTLSEEDKAYMDEYYENGIYVDGFVRLYAQNEEAVDLSLPFLGFYGDWSDARVFDSGWYYEENPEINRYINVIYTGFGGYDSALGWNPYIKDEYDPSHNVLSPNNDGYYDTIDDIYLSLMRNAKEVDFTWTNVETGKTLFQTGAEYVRKTFYRTAYELCFPMILSQYCEMYDFDGVRNNDQLALTVEAWLDDGNDEADETITVPVYIDTEAPVLYTDEIAYLYNPYTDTRRIEFFVSDNYKIAAVAVLTEAQTPFELMTVENVPGEKTLLSLDVTDYDGTFYLAVCDYGCNETYYKVTFTGKDNVDMDAFYGYRTWSSYLNGGYLFGTGAWNGWYSFETADTMLQHTSQPASGETNVYAAEYVDGYVIGVDAAGTIFAMKAGTWDRTELGALRVNYRAYPALDMAFDYTTDTLYVLTDELDPGTGQHLAKLDYLTGAVTDVGIVTGIKSLAAAGITLACDNDGILYTVDYDTGALYTIDKETAAATLVGQTGFKPYYQQSMTVDHATNKLYWAAYQGYNQENAFYEVNKTTGELTKVADIQNNGEMTGLFKPWRSGKRLYPQTDPEKLVLSRSELNMCVGNTATLLCSPWPYYAEAGQMTWTSSDETVATVKNGVVTAVGEGEAVITVTNGQVSVTCPVVVAAITGDLRLYNTMGRKWMQLDAAAPKNATGVVGATSSVFGFTAACYWNGNVYTTDSRGGFYRLDAETLKGLKLSSETVKLTALSYNYANAIMYGIEHEASGGDGAYYLVQMNPNTGDSLRLCEVSSQVGLPIGGMAIDFDGNFYLFCLNKETWQMELVKFRLENDALADVEKAALPELNVPDNYFSMTCSHDNGGLFCAFDGGKLLWLNTADMEHVSILDLGEIPETTASGISSNTCLLEIPAQEPKPNYPAVTEAHIAGSYQLLEGGTTMVGLEFKPWNANPGIAYSTKDPDVATVSADGIITAMAPGETTLAVRVQGLDEALEAPIIVKESAGRLYGVLLSNFIWTPSCSWMKVESSQPGTSVEVIRYQQDWWFYSGAYYDGYIYSYAQSTTFNAATNKDVMFYMVKVDAVDYTVEVLQQVHYTLRDMEFDYTTGAMYAIATDNVMAGALAQVDLETGEVIIVGDTGIDLAAITVDDQGRVFAIGVDGNLYRIDKDTAEPTLVGSTGHNVGTDMYGHVLYQSMHYDHNTGNTFWAEGYGSLSLVDLETGIATDLGLMASNGIQMSCVHTLPKNPIAVPETVAPTGVRIDEKNTVAVGKTLSLTAHVLLVSVAAVDQTLTWASGDESIATVKDGVVTGVGAGTVTITATTANGKTDTCTVYVTANERRFYAYDEDNTRWISFTAEDTANVTAERTDAEGEAPISASAWTGDTLYAFDKEGRFFSIDPDTFERTQVGDGFYGEIINYKNRAECQIFPVDMSYDEATGKLYVQVLGVRPITGATVPYQAYVSQLREVDMATGETEVVYQDDTIAPANVMVLNDRVFFIDHFQNGIFKYYDLNSADQNIYRPYMVRGYWGLCWGGRSYFRDEYTGTVYAIRDLNSRQKNQTKSTLCTLTLGDAGITELGLIGEGIVANSLFIR